MSNRCAYKLLAAIADYREQEKNVPEGVEEHLEALESALDSAKAEKSAEGESSSFAGAKKRAAAKFRGEDDE